MQEAKQGAENIQPMRRQEAPAAYSWLYSGKQTRSVPHVLSSFISPFALLKVRVEHQDLHPHVQGYPAPRLGRHRVVQAQAVCMVGRDYFEACEGLVRAEETGSLVLKQQKAMTEEPHLLSKD